MSEFPEYDGSCNLFEWTLKEAARVRAVKQKEVTKGLLIKSMAHEDWRASWIEADKKMFEKKEEQAAARTERRGGVRDLTPITGERFGRLVGVELLPPVPKQGTKGLFRCDCGALAEVIVAAARQGQVSSCGCLKKEHAKTFASKAASARWKRVTNEAT